jgi:hypothetical protein
MSRRKSRFRGVDGLNCEAKNEKGSSVIEITFKITSIPQYLLLELDHSLKRNAEISSGQMTKGRIVRSTIT